MRCITCGEDSEYQFCVEHNNEDRLLRTEGSVNAPQFTGIISAETYLSNNRGADSLRFVLKWIINSGYFAWAKNSIHPETYKYLSYEAHGDKLKQEVTIKIVQILRDFRWALYDVEHTVENIGDQVIVSIKWNDWKKVEKNLNQSYPIGKHNLESWFPIKAKPSSNPEVMRIVNENTYTSEVAINRGKIQGGEFIATHGGAFRKFQDLFEDSHRVGSKKIGKFGRRYTAPASIENLEKLLIVACQTLDTKLEACVEIIRQHRHQEALAETFRWRMCTKKYDEAGLHRYIFDEKPSAFNPILSEKIKNDDLEVWDKYLNIYKPYSQQKITAEASWHARYVSWWIDMRVGKTPTAMMVMNRALREKTVDHWVVVCPAINLYDPWLTELEKQGCFRVCVLDEGQATDMDNVKSELYDIYLVSYSSLGRRLRMMNKFWSMERVGVVMDETSLIKNPKSNRAKACINLTRHSPYVFALNGTPLAQGPQDIWTQQMAVDQGVTFGTSPREFALKWLEQYTQGKYRVHKDLNTIFELKLAGSSIRYIRSEADQFNRRDKNFRYVCMPNTEQMKKSTEEIVLGYTRDENKDPREIKTCILTVYGHLRECCAAYDKYEIVEDSSDYRRVRHTVDPKNVWVRTFLKGNPGMPLIVFSEFSESEDRLMEMLDDEGISYSSMRRRGGKSTLTGMQRQEEIRKFQEGETRVIIMKTVSAKGVTLNRKPAVKAGIGGYPAIVYMQPTWSLIDWEQSQDRAVGTDDKSGNSISTMIYALIIQGSIEEKIIQALRGKKNVAEALLADAARNGYTNPFEGMDLSGSDFEGDDYFDSVEMEARYVLGLPPQKKLSERSIRKADIKYRAKKYGTTQKVAAERPIGEYAVYLLSKHANLPFEVIGDQS